MRRRGLCTERVASLDTLEHWLISKPSGLIHRSKFDILLSREEEWHRVQATRFLSQAQVALILDGHVQLGGGGRGEHHQVRGGREMKRQNRNQWAVKFCVSNK